jgi:uncharacterized membrane protein
MFMFTASFLQFVVTVELYEYKQLIFDHVTHVTLVIKVLTLCIVGKVANAPVNAPIPTPSNFLCSCS